MPGNADGSLDGITLKPLTVAFHEPGFIATLQQENQQPFWFQMSAEQKQQAGNPMGPANPQALNRYSYVQNNPLRWTDPSGHKSVTVDANEVDDLGQTELDRLATLVNDTFTNFWIDAGGFTLLAGAGAGVATTPVGGLIVAGALAGTTVIIQRDIYRVSTMLREAQKFVSANVGGEVVITNVDGNITIEAVSNNVSKNGYNVFRQATKVVTGASMMIDKMLYDTFGANRYG